MARFTVDNRAFDSFYSCVEEITADIADRAKEEDIRALRDLAGHFRMKTEDFFRENRKLNIGVVGQVKAGKSSFLNTLLFGGEEILPKASTPKTATLTKMEYADHNSIQIEYYSLEEWEVLEENALVDFDDEIYTSAREIVELVRKNGVDPHPYLEKGWDTIDFDTYEELLLNLNSYVGEDGRFTPIVKAVTLYLNKEEFQGLSIVDTPGLNDPIASRTIRTKEFMEVCDVVFFLSQSGSFLDKSDWTLLSSQLPQKGVKRLILIASKYDSGIRDILRVSDDDDLFGDDENTADNIPKACKIIGRKLKKRAKAKVEEFVKDLQARDSLPELIDVIRQCTDPVMVSSLARNMSAKDESEYTPEERNLSAALRQFSNDLQSDLRLLGNFDQVTALFDEVVAEKEQVLQSRAESFLPNAKEELKSLLHAFLDKTEKRVRLLNDNDREKLLEQKKFTESRMGNIKADIAAVFGDLYARLESEKNAGIRELREAAKDYLNVKERTGTTTHTGTYTTGHLWWKKTHSYTYEEHYSYCIAADAIENLNRYALDACSQIEEVFCEALNIKEIKRKLLQVVVDNFDLGDENYDSSLFRIMVEESVGAIEFPVFNMDISEAMGGIAGKFSGELTSADQKNQLAAALSTAVSRIYNELCSRLEQEARRFRENMAAIEGQVSDQLLHNISDEFQTLLRQCEDKDREIADYQEYERILTAALTKI